MPLSVIIASAFQTQCDVVTENATHDFLMAARNVGGDMTARGAFSSSMHILELDRVASEVVKNAAAQIYGVLVRVTAASRQQEPDIPDLQRAFEAALRNTADRVAGEWTSRVRPIHSGLGGTYPPTQQERVLEQAVRHYSAEITIEVVARMNGTQPSSNVFHMSGNIGSVQTGNNATANVAMTID